jgi:hypothetical protein
MGLPKTKPSASSLTTAAGESKEGTCQNLPNSTKIPETMIPAPQRERIMQRHTLGQSIRRIAREENRARETVTKIVRSDDMRAYVTGLRERFYGLGDLALSAVEHALSLAKDSQLGYRLLIDIGVVPSPFERELIQTNREVIKQASMNDWERTLVGDAEGNVAQLMIGMGRVAQSRAELYGFELPSPQKIRCNRAVAYMIDVLTKGRNEEFYHSNPAEWNRLRRQIEEQFPILKDADKNEEVGAPPRQYRRPEVDGQLPGVAAEPAAKDGSASPLASGR